MLLAVARCGQVQVQLPTSAVGDGKGTWDAVRLFFQVINYGELGQLVRIGMGQQDTAPSPVDLSICSAQAVRSQTLGPIEALACAHRQISRRRSALSGQDWKTQRALRCYCC